MNLNILLAYPRKSAEMWAPITEAIRKRNDTVVEAHDQADVDAKMRTTSQWDAVLSTIDLPKRQDSLTTDIHGGLESLSEVLEKFRANEKLRAKKPPGMGLVLPFENRDVSRKVRYLDPGPELFYHSNLQRDLLEYLRDLVPRARCLDVVIRAHPGGWRYEIRGMGFDFETRSKPLKIPKALTDSWEEWSRPINLGTEDWRAKFNFLGQNMIEAFCGTSKSFENDLDAGVKAAGGLANTRLTFAITTEYYPIALESIFMRRKPEPWMTEAPLVRTLAPNKIAARVTLIEPRGGFLRCLVLCADAHGYVDDIPTPQGTAARFLPLPNAQREAEMICRMLRRGARRGLPIKDPVMFGTAANPLTHSMLKSLLAGSWDVIHFAGHAHYEKKEDGAGRGHLIVHADRPQDGPVAVPIEEIAQQLLGVKLLYLSSCRSASARFATEAAKRGVPAVIGFSSPVGDRYAYLCAKRFYLGLMACRTIDAAFFNARKSLYRRYRNSMPANNTWASGVVVMGRGS